VLDDTREGAHDAQASLNELCIAAYEGDTSCDAAEVAAPIATEEVAVAEASEAVAEASEAVAEASEAVAEEAIATEEVAPIAAIEAAAPVAADT